MEALALHGLATVLFLDRPTEAMRQRFPDARAIGLAGTSRSETPDWMEDHLAPALQWLKGLGARFCHYKVCSTFDSSPTIGSIGRAIDIGQRIFGNPTVPLVVGAPELKRYTAFGELYAAFRGTVYRIDRHPVMSRHPVTPMAEADVLSHLGAQTRKSMALVDFVTLKRADQDEAVDALLARQDAVLLFDVLDEETQRAAGRQLLRLGGSGGPLFVAGSSGVEYALFRAWEGEAGVRDGSGFPAVTPVAQCAVVSGSVSPTTERQIAHAAANGFDLVALDPRALAEGAHGKAENDAIASASASLAAGRSVLVHTAMGPSSDRGAELDGKPGSRHRIGSALGRILAGLVGRHRLSRAVIAGGDTSSHALRGLGIEALTIRMPFPQTPGSPLCLAHAADPDFDGLEIALKGGQVGGDDYFSMIRDGRSTGGS
jgi:3-oxoisoapionate kinase